MTITVKELSKKYAGRTLFENVTLSFTPPNRYGLTGPNGSGKSTFLKILSQQQAATSGSVSLPERIGILRQDIHPFAQYKVLDVVLMGNARLWEALCEKERLYESDGDIGIRLGELEEIIAEEDGYTAEAEAEKLLLGIGVAQAYFHKHMHEVSQDLQFRALLAQALFGCPQALFLDEPTNHLDLVSIKWLEETLRSFSGTIIVISHDRHFLNAVATHIADIDYDDIIIYPGNYDEMTVAKASIRQRVEADNKSKEKKVAQLKEFVAKFGAGTRASQVQSRLKEIEKLQPQELKKSNIQRPYIIFPTPFPSGQKVLQLHKISKSYDHEVIAPFSLEIMKGDKIGVIGNNGQGKTTLLKLCAQQLSPDKGSITVGHQVKIGYFPQVHGEAFTPEAIDHTLFDFLKQVKSGLYDQDVRSVLGKMLFSGEDAFKAVKALSGGETARLLLSAMMLEEHNVLILDEPNNHLDLEAVSALATALQQYQGTVVVASHDRDLIDKVATKILAFESGKLILFQGTLQEYLEQKEAR